MLWSFGRIDDFATLPILDGEIIQKLSFNVLLYLLASLINKT